MIDDKKIEAAAFEEYPLNSDGNIIGRHGFKEGAKWAINEFLKDLLHPASEVPRYDNGKVLAFSREVGYRNLYNMYDMMSKTTCDTYQEMWELEVKAYRLDGWIYADKLFDLIIKGGNHD